MEDCVIKGKCSFRSVPPSSTAKLETNIMMSAVKALKGSHQRSAAFAGAKRAGEP
jgi:hypothetical protein